MLDGCGQMDDKCYQDVLGILQSATLEVDKKLEPRGFGAFISKTVKGASSWLLNIYAALELSWKLKSKERNGEFDNFTHIPVSIAEQAGKLANAPDVVVSAAGTAVATIKPTPKPTSLTGCAIINVLNTITS